MSVDGIPSASQSPLQISVSAYAGRTYHASRSVFPGEVLLDVATPYACTIYKQFRTEVCAECWKYDGGRRGFLTSRDMSERAGLSFCDNDCKSRWLEREGEDMVDVLAVLESARRRKQKGKDREDSSSIAYTSAVDEMEDLISRSWDTVRQQEHNPKYLRQWKNIQLDDFQVDLARYVLVSMYHLAREVQANASKMESPTSSQAHNVPVSNQDVLLPHFGGALWNDFASLQYGELQQIKKCPELLVDHIRIYQVLKARFLAPHLAAQIDKCSQHHATDMRMRLAEVITVDNVRKALGVDPGNSFGIWETPLTEESEGLGFGVYPIPSFFNHHCSPNVRKERNGRRLRFVTTKSVEAGEELCISYGHVEGMNLSQRTKELKDGWFFECRCSRCVSEGNSHQE